jgi:phosphatidate cytidylyltransferase
MTSDGTSETAIVGRPPSPAPPPSKAGRNLPAAIAVGVLLAAAVLGSLAFGDGRYFLALVALAMVLGVWEMRRALAQAGLEVPLIPCAVGALSMIVSAYVGGGQALAVTFGLSCVAVLLWRVADGVGNAARDIAGGMLVLLYPSFLAGFASLLLAPSDGRLRVIVFLLVTVCSDVGGFAAGVTFGRHPMAPSLSPKKSWEGFVGSVVLCCVAAAAAISLMLGGPWWGGLLVGLAVAVAATLGDLMESSIKRDLGIKDMGNILPGHGGIMDRIDSLVVTAPLVWGLLLVLVPIAT